MYLFQILLPLKDNTGKPFAAEAFERLKEELAGVYGGVTAFLQSPAQGMWRHGTGPDEEEIVIFEVMAREIDAASWRFRRKELERRFRQERVIIRYMAVSLV